MEPRTVNLEPMEIAAQLEGQLDDIIQMYDCAEKSYSYEHTRPKPYQHNEHLQRQNIAQFASEGPTSSAQLAGSMLYGLAAVYLVSRRGAKGLADMSPAKVCYFRTASWFMMGTSLGVMTKVGNLAQQQSQLGLNTRVVQNEQAHNVLRSMKFHLNTRQMGIWD